MQVNMPYFLRVEHLAKQVKSGDNQIIILRDVNLTIKAGESIAIMGKSGSGKTTLLSLLAGLDLPTSGNIYFLKHHLNNLNDDERALIRSREVGFIFQSFYLLPSLTALENVMLPLEIQYKKHSIAKKEAMKWLMRVGLNERLHHYPLQLSGGEQQRVAIARAFVNQPKIIFSDEMTGNLDEQTGQLINDMIFSLNQEHNMTFVLVTHDNKLASRCHRVMLLHDGVLKSC